MKISRRRKTLRWFARRIYLCNWPTARHWYSKPNPDVFAGRLIFLTQP